MLGVAEEHVSDFQALRDTYHANNGQLPDTTNTEQTDNQSVSSHTNMDTQELLDTEQPTSPSRPGIQDVVATPGHIVGGDAASSDRQSGERHKRPQLLQGMFDAVNESFSNQHSEADDSDVAQHDLPSQDVDSVRDNSEPQPEIDEAMHNAESQSEPTSKFALSTPPPDPRPGHPTNNKRRRISLSFNADAGSLVAAAVQHQRKRAHHGLGYTSPTTRSTASSDHHEDVLRYVRDQALANRNPHGSEALANRHAALSDKANKQQTRREFEKDAASDTIPEYNQLYKGTGTPPISSDKSSSSSSTHSKVDKPTSAPVATPEAITAGRQQLHARSLKLSEELCKAVDNNDTIRVAAIQPVLETLRNTFESKAVDKRRVPQPKNWPEFPAARYNLNNIMERDTRGALLEAWKKAQIAQLDESWSLTWFYKVLNHFKAEKSTLSYIRDNMETLKVWTPTSQIERICAHDTQATVDPAMRKLTKGYALDQRFQ